MPTFTVDWVSENTAVWELHLARFKGQPNLLFLEIGNFEGRSALWFLENILTDSSSRIVCVDPDEKPLFHQNIQPYKDKVIFHRQKSKDFLKQALEQFDLIYIDGSHLAQDTLTDLILSWDRLKTGGFMIVDDCGCEAGWHEKENPKVAIDAFLRIYYEELHLLYDDYQVIIQKGG